VIGHHVLATRKKSSQVIVETKGSRKPVGHMADEICYVYCPATLIRKHLYRSLNAIY